jgi:hypothetical protein
LNPVSKAALREIQNSREGEFNSVRMEFRIAGSGEFKILCVRFKTAGRGNSIIPTWNSEFAV